MSGHWDRLEAAQRYAAAGWPVFPLLPQEKTPAVPHGFKDATTDPKTITRWWDRNPDRNVAVATGHPGPDVLDVDHHGGRSGFPSYNQLQRESLVPAAAALIRTPNGGIHAYYRGTGQRSGSIPGHHIDYRARGGYVAAPPSAVRARDGQIRQYEVVSHTPSVATFDWEAARRALEPHRDYPPRRERPAARPASLEHLPRWVAEQQEGNRNAGLFWAACRAAEAKDTATLDSLARAARSAGLENREIDRTVRSAQRAAAQAALFRHLEREAG